MTRSLIFLAAVLPLAGATLEECRAFRLHGNTKEAGNCFNQLATNRDPYLRAEGFWGLGDFSAASDSFRAAATNEPKSAHVRVRWGRLFLERFNREEAAGLFQEALDLHGDDSQAYLGLALVAARGFDVKAVEFAAKALELDPKLLEAQTLLAHLALEENDRPRAAAVANKAIALSGDALDAMAILGVMDLLDGHAASPWFPRIFNINPNYGEAYEAAGYFFVLNRRYEEAIAFYRKALDLNPRLWSARASLGVTLMRLGEEAEARHQLEQCYENNYRNAETVNTLRLLDSYKNFETFTTPRTILRLHKKEAAVLRPYFQAELDRDIADYEAKYKFKLPGPVQLEVYPNHEDFAVRTMGLPGLGALGVTFGRVVAMDSPSGRPPGQFHWASTLRHEMSHVYVLSMTRHLVPRWFTEGIAVHEESAASPDWGDRLDPSSIRAIQDKKLLPVAELDSGFVRPSYPAQVVVSYFQAGRICDFIVEKWGDGKILAMIESYAASKPTPEVILENLGVSDREFDTQFLVWLDQHTKSVVEHFAEWKKRVAAIDKTKPEDVIREGLAIRDFYPDFVEHGSVYELLASAYEAKGIMPAAIAELERYRDAGGRNPTLLKKLAALEPDPSAIVTLTKLLYIAPQDPDVHLRLGGLLLNQGDAPSAIREYTALLASKPLDPAESHFQLARALRAAKRIDDARDEVLQALETAPGFRPAQQLLLELSK